MQRTNPTAVREHLGPRAEYHSWHNVLYSTRENASLSTSSPVRHGANRYGGATLAVPAADIGAFEYRPRT
jgi:hypothetical protein